MNEEKYVEMLENGELYDYITNLQQENNNLKTSLDESQEVVIDLQQENERLKEKVKHYEETQTFGDYVKEVNLLVDYKSRIEKAIEYIKEMDTQLEVYGDYDILSDNKNDLLNILNDRSDE